MSHYRKIVLDGTEFQYAVGRQSTFIRTVGSFNHCQWAFCTDTSMDQYAVTPAMVEYMIRKNRGENPPHWHFQRDIATVD